jgi:hypothetical protein
MGTLDKNLEKSNLIMMSNEESADKKSVLG